MVISFFFANDAEQTASTIPFGPRVNFIRYEEAEEVGGTVVNLAGWGATTVDLHFDLHIEPSCIINLLIKH